MKYQLKLKHFIAGNWVGGSDSFESSPSSGRGHSFQQVQTNWWIRRLALPRRRLSLIRKRLGGIVPIF